MGRLITIGVVVVSLLLIWKGGVLNSMLPQPAPPPLDPGPIISKSGDAMQNLKSVHLSLTGTLVMNGVAGVKVTGSGDLIYPHKENLSLQLQIPSPDGQTAIVAINERIENGHEYLQIPAQGSAWKDVTGNSSGQIAPGMDPIANLEFAHSFRASDDLGDITMDNIDVHHFSLTVDPGKYVDQLKQDPSSGITASDEAALTNAGIEVEVWISASDRYIHQMKIDMTTSQFTWNVTYHFSSFVTGGGST
ncbi:MAG TPA: hypothetical protein VF942_10095, partial [Acidimicrobiales bacterium]